MSNLAGGESSTSAGNARSGRPQVPGTSGSPGMNIRGPRAIMQEREARDRRKQEEAQRQELARIHAEEEARLVEQRRDMAERRAAEVAGAAAQQQRRSGGEGGQRGSSGTVGQRTSGNSQQSGRVVSGERQADQLLQAVGRGGPAIGGGETATTRRARPPQPPSQLPRPAPSEPSRTRPPQSAPAAAPPPVDPPSQVPSGGQARSSFPHAFERWETLSAHWEGLTSFWIRRLEENSNEINKEPISQQLSRQVTDLSAAGANLFHAVVELQRLRASSERKFQRWFFETRAENERHQEIQAQMQAQLHDEREKRAEAVRAASVAVAPDTSEADRTRITVDKQLADMKRELQIAKDEAKRAWEELGRREEEERERTASLREGRATIVGGVQVVPMMQGVPSRHGSARATGQLGQDSEGPIDDSDAAYQQYSRSQRADPTDPFVEQDITPTRVPGRSGRTPTAQPQEYTQAPAVQPAISTFYQQPSTSIHPVDPTNRSEHNPSYGPSVQSSGAFSEEEYQIDPEGQFVRDERGNKILYTRQSTLSEDDDEDQYDEGIARERELAREHDYGRAAVPGVEYGRGPTTSIQPSARLQAPTSHPTTTSAEEAADYTGQGYGSGPGWETVPRHHHPTRLSDVLEEDERSRTSASQVSRQN